MPLLTALGRGSSQDVAAGELLTLRQGRQSVMDFAVDFWIVARHSGWPAEPLIGAFLSGLVDHIRHLLIAYPRPATLEDMINLAIEVNQQLQNL